MWNTITTLFRGYMGTGLIVGLFLVALVYLFLEEKEKWKRVMFLYMPAAVLALYFCPIFGKIVLGILGNEIYYRILWLLPITVVIAYVAVDVCRKMKGIKRVLFGSAVAAMIMFSGSYIYDNQYFHKAENEYHVPQAVMEVCDAIVVEGREVMAVFPSEMIQFVRQYTPYVCMPYGRDVLIDRWNVYNELYLVMEAPKLDVEKLVELARKSRCHYVILRESKPRNGEITEYDFDFFDQIGEYEIYVDNTLYRGL